jgi:flagellar basal-body rod modification protein FlgD
MNSGKIGTKAFADRKETNFITKDSGLKNLSATDNEKLNGQSVGEVLNKIADPNWIDPKKKLRTVGDQQMDKNAFMKLMLTQMKNQDPTNPIQAHEMAAQLAAFTSVEQLQNLNSTMQEMKKEQSPTVNFEALNFIGKSASGDSSELLRLKEDKTHEIKFNIPREAAAASVKIRNSQGETVRVLELRDLKAGSNNVNWNGQDERGVDTPPDNYQVFIEAKDKMDNKILAETKFDGTITGVNFSAQGPVLIIGNQSVRLADVKKIVDPRMTNPDLQKTPGENENKVSADTQKEVKAPLMPADAKIEESAATAQEREKAPGNASSKAPKASDLERMKKITEEMAAKEIKDNKAAVKKDELGNGNLQDVSMSRKVAEKVEKETGKEITI